MRKRRHTRVFTSMMNHYALSFPRVAASGAASGGSSQLKRQDRQSRVLSAGKPAAAVKRAAETPLQIPSASWFKPVLWSSMLGRNGRETERTRITTSLGGKKHPLCKLCSSLCNRKDDEKERATEDAMSRSRARTAEACRNRKSWMFFWCSSSLFIPPLMKTFHQYFRSNSLKSQSLMISASDLKKSWESHLRFKNRSCSRRHGSIH